jgi:GNAT superfamily N-acetyltransferase
LKPSLVLRPAGAADAPDAARVLIESRRELMPFAPSAHTDNEVRGWVREVLIPGGGVTLACCGHSTVGVLAVSTVEGVAWIDQLYVHPQHIAQGVGRALLAHALATLPRPVQLYTFQANRRARDFYEKRGFTAVALGDGTGNEERCPDVLYRLDAAGPALRSPP